MRKKINPEGVELTTSGVGGGSSHEGSCLVHLQQQLLLLVQIGAIDPIHQRSN